MASEASFSSALEYAAQQSLGGNVSCLSRSPRLPPSLLLEAFSLKVYTPPKH